MAFTIEVVEKEDATGFKLYDVTNWPAFNSALVIPASLILTVEYGGHTYTYVPAGGISLYTAMGIGVTYVNLCGPALNSYFEVTPDHLYDGATQLNSAYFPDGYYEITLAVTYNAIAESDYSYQGFLAESYLMASKLPLLIDMDDFDYEENRLQFLCIAMLRSATWAAELGRETDFTTLTAKINEFLDARSINEIWST
jgi:hypothetical protein